MPKNIRDQLDFVQEKIRTLTCPSRGSGKKPERLPAKQGGGEITNGIRQDSPKNTPAKPSDSKGTEKEQLFDFI
jgi:hypothetical protein